MSIQNLLGGILFSMLLIMTSSFAIARSNGVHWVTVSHYHPPQLAVGWVNVGHWATLGGHFDAPDPTQFRTIASGGSVLTAATGFGDNMFDLVLMDDHMNMLAHRTTADLATLQNSWTLDKISTGTDGYQFQWQQFQLSTNDGYSENLFTPMTIPMALTLLTPDPTPGSTLYDAVFQGTIPAGGMQWTVVDPIYGSTPYILQNEAPAQFEVFLQFAVPEPSLGWLFVMGIACCILYRVFKKTRQFQNSYS